MNKCRTYCKRLGHEYTTDEYDYITGLTGYKCEKYKKYLGNQPVKCEECVQNKRSDYT